MISDAENRASEISDGVITGGYLKSRITAPFTMVAGGFLDKSMVFADTTTFLRTKRSHEY